MVSAKATNQAASDLANDRCWPMNQYEYVWINDGEYSVIFGPHMALFSAHEIVRGLPLNMFRAFAHRAAAYRVTIIGSCLHDLQNAAAAGLCLYAVTGVWWVQPLPLGELQAHRTAWFVQWACLLPNRFLFSKNLFAGSYLYRDMYKQSAKLNRTLNSAVFFNAHWPIKNQNQP